MVQRAPQRVKTVDTQKWSVPMGLSEATGTFKSQPPPGTRERNSRRIGKAAQLHAEQNSIAAHVILTDPDGYGGEEALAVRWARLTVQETDQNAVAA